MRQARSNILVLCIVYGSQSLKGQVEGLEPEEASTQLARFAPLRPTARHQSGVFAL